MRIRTFFTIALIVAGLVGLNMLAEPALEKIGEAEAALSDIGDRVAIRE